MDRRHYLLRIAKFVAMLFVLYQGTLMMDQPVSKPITASTFTDIVIT